MNNSALSKVDGLEDLVEGELTAGSLSSNKNMLGLLIRHLRTKLIIEILLDINLYIRSDVIPVKLE